MVKTEKYSVKLNEIEFITWKENDEDGTWWAKFHMPSGKELREVFASEKELEDFVQEWAESKGIKEIKIMEE
jgi:hypothetical protein